MPENIEQKKDTKFQPGQSGNPKGRTPGTKNQSTLLKEALIKILFDRKDELKKLDVKDLLKPVASLLPKEQTVRIDSEPITLIIQKSGDGLPPDDPVEYPEDSNDDE